MHGVKNIQIFSDSIVDTLSESDAPQTTDIKIIQVNSKMQKMSSQRQVSTRLPLNHNIPEDSKEDETELSKTVTGQRRKSMSRLENTHSTNSDFHKTDGSSKETIEPNVI